MAGELKQQILLAIKTAGIIEASKKFLNLSKSTKVVVGTIAALATSFVVLGLKSEKLGKLLKANRTDMSRFNDDTAGLIKTTSVLTEAIRFQEANLRLNAEEMRALGVKAEEFAAKHGKNATEVFEQLSEAVLTGGEELFQFGIRLKEGASMTEITKDALKQLQEQTKGSTNTIHSWGAKYTSISNSVSTVFDASMSSMVSALFRIGSSLDGGLDSLGEYEAAIIETGGAISDWKFTTEGMNNTLQRGHGSLLEYMTGASQLATGLNELKGIEHELNQTLREGNRIYKWKTDLLKKRHENDMRRKREAAAEANREAAAAKRVQNKEDVRELAAEVDRSFAAIDDFVARTQRKKKLTIEEAIEGKVLKERQRALNKQFAEQARLRGLETSIQFKADMIRIERDLEKDIPSGKLKILDPGFKEPEREKTDLELEREREKEERLAPFEQISKEEQQNIKAGHLRDLDNLIKREELIKQKKLGLRLEAAAVDLQDALDDMEFKRKMDAIDLKREQEHQARILETKRTSIGMAQSFLSNIAGATDTTNKKGFEANKKLRRAENAASTAVNVGLAWKTALGSGLPLPIAIAAGATLSGSVIALGVRNDQNISKLKYNGGGVTAAASAATPSFDSGGGGDSGEGESRDLTINVTVAGQNLFNEMIKVNNFEHQAGNMHFQSKAS